MMKAKTIIMGMSNSSKIIVTITTFVLIILSLQLALPEIIDEVFYKQAERNFNSNRAQMKIELYNKLTSEEKLQYKLSKSRKMRK